MPVAPRPQAARAPTSTHWPNGGAKLDFNNWIALWPQFVQPNPPALLSLDFRRALMYALDRQSMVDTLENGVSPVADTWVSPNEAVFQAIEPSIVHYAYDPQRAMQLIAGLGYTFGSDGLFHDVAGLPLTLEVRTSGDDPTQEAGTLTAANAFRQVGIAADPFIIPQAQRADLEFNVSFPGVRLWRQPNDIWSLDRYTSRQAALAANHFRGSNLNRYMSPVLDDLVDRYLTTIDETDRLPVLGQIVQHMSENLAHLDLWYDSRVTVVGSRLRNVTNMAWNGQDWDVVGVA